MSRRILRWLRGNCIFRDVAYLLDASINGIWVYEADVDSWEGFSFGLDAFSDSAVTSWLYKCLENMTREFIILILQ